MEYWEWWIGALSLGFFAIFYSLFTGKPLGVSGSWLSIARRRDDAVLRSSVKVMEETDKDEIKDDLLAMTMAEFGAEVVAGKPQRRAGEFNSGGDFQVDPNAKQAEYTPWTVHVVFLFMMFVGSYLASIYTGDFAISIELSPKHVKIFENTGEAWIALFFGGMMVGFGTQMAGGCTSGHGLVGCSQLVPASLVATAAFFFCSAIVLTLIMNSLI